MSTKVLFILVGVLVCAGIAGLFAWNTISPGTLHLVQNGPLPVACTMEAKVCPDGSYVGRSGPKCEFAACPEAAGDTIPSVGLGATVQIESIRITPLSVVEDSRCPSDVVCIQAGTVRVSVRLDTEGQQTTTTLKLNEKASFAGRTVQLIKVLPEKNSKTSTEPSDYRFTFNVVVE